MKKEKIVLIIDDDEDDRALFFDAVKTIDPDIICFSARNGQEGLEFLNNKKFRLPDYIFLDLNMPRIDGRQCLAMIKKDKRLSDIPIIIYSTSNRPEDIAECRRLGAVRFITKPTLYSEICKGIASVLKA